MKASIVAVVAALTLISACGKKGHWEGQPGKAQKPIAGKFMGGELTDKIGEQVDKYDPTVKKDVPAEPATAPEVAPQPVAAAPAAAVAEIPVAALPAAASLPPTGGGSLLMNVQMTVLKWSALNGKNWVLVGLDENISTGAVVARVQAVKGTSAQTLPFGPMADELRGQLESQIPRLKGQPKLLTVELLDEAGKPVGRFDGSGWIFGPAK